MTDSPLMELHVLITRDHTVLSATDTFIHKWNDPYLPLLPSHTASSQIAKCRPAGMPAHQFRVCMVRV